MERKQMRYIALCAVMFVVLATALWFAGAHMVAVEASPPAAPTPVVTGWNPSSAYKLVTFWDTQTITADGGSTVFALPEYTVLDYQYVIDQGTTNTVTLKLQHSNNGQHWTDGATLVSNNAADANALNQALNFGLFTRIYADVTNTNTLTITVTGLAK